MDKDLEIKLLREALSFYAIEAEAIAKNIDDNPEALLASITILSLDGGARGRSLKEPTNKAKMNAYETLEGRLQNTEHLLVVLAKIIKHNHFDIQVEQLLDDYIDANEDLGSKLGGKFKPIPEFVTRGE